MNQEYSHYNQSPKKSKKNIVIIALIVIVVVVVAILATVMFWMNGQSDSDSEINMENNCNGTIEVWIYLNDQQTYHGFISAYDSQTIVIETGNSGELYTKMKYNGQIWTSNNLSWDGELGNIDIRYYSFTPPLIDL